MKVLNANMRIIVLAVILASIVFFYCFRSSAEGRRIIDTEAKKCSEFVKIGVSLQNKLHLILKKSYKNRSIVFPGELTVGLRSLAMVVLDNANAGYSIMLSPDTIDKSYTPKPGDYWRIIIKSDPNFLTLSQQSLDDISSLPVYELDLNSSDISDLSVLRKMPIEKLCLRNMTKVNFEVLKDCKNLRNIDISHCDIEDLGFVRNLKIGALKCSDTKIRDIAPLNRCTVLSQLDISYTRVNDISPLMNCRNLLDLNLRNTKVADLSPLEGLPIQSLDLTGTAVKNLEIIRGLPLQWLYIDASNVNPSLLNDLITRNVKIR